MRKLLGNSRARERINIRDRGPGVQLCALVAEGILEDPIGRHI